MIDDAGRSLFRTPATLPRRWAPQGMRADEHRGTTCPERLPPRVWHALARWRDWKRYGTLPEPGTSGDQSSWLLDAFAVLDGANGLIELAQQEEASDRAKAQAR